MRGKRQLTLRAMIAHWFWREFNLDPHDLDIQIGRVVLPEFTIQWAIAVIILCALGVFTLWAFCFIMIVAGG